MAKSKKAPTPGIEVIRAEPFFSTYANHIGVQTTPWDIKLTFGEIVALRPDKIAVKETGSITISPEQAKALVPLLEQQLKVYESLNGPIPVPGGGPAGNVTVTPGTGSLSAEGAAPRTERS